MSVAALLAVELDASKPPKTHTLDGVFAGVQVRLRPKTPAIHRAAVEIADGGPKRLEALTKFAQTCWTRMLDTARLTGLRRLQDQRAELAASLDGMRALAAREEATDELRAELQTAEDLFEGLSNAIDRFDAEDDDDFLTEEDVLRTLYALKATDLQAWAACKEYERWNERYTLALVSLCVTDLSLEGAPIPGWERCDFDDAADVSRHLQGIQREEARGAFFSALHMLVLAGELSEGKDASSGSRSGTDAAGDAAPSTAPTAPPS